MSDLTAGLDIVAQAPYLSQQSVNILRVHNPGNAIQDALQVPNLAESSTSVLLVGLLIDDSGSIAYAGNTQAICDGINHIVTSLDATRDADDIQIMIHFLNRGEFYAFGDLDNVPTITPSNYAPGGGTPLFSRSIQFLRALIQESEMYSQYGVEVRTMSMILSDGANNMSMVSADDVAAIVQDMTNSQDHIIAAMGVDDGDGTDFEAVFMSMGIPNEWIYETGPKGAETEEEFQRRIRRGFGMFSKSAARASKSSAAFSQLGGFGN